MFTFYLYDKKKDLKEVLILNLGIKDRVAIVTGSSQGIGKAIAYNLAKEGAKIVICARNQEKILETVKEFEESNITDLLHIQADLKNKKDIQSLDKLIEPVYTKMKNRGYSDEELQR